MAEYREFHCPYGDDFEGGDECDRCEQYELCMETPSANVIEIPKDATDGDMLKAIFSESDGYEYAINEDLDIATMFVVKDGQAFYVNFDLSWFNAPYEKGKVVDNG